jgi:ABC-2 type transport system permease protein
MSKLFAVFKREYLQAVRKKMFIIMTVLLPVLMAAIFILPNMMMVRGMGKKKIVALDGTGRLRDAFTRPAPAAKQESPLPRRSQIPTSMDISYVDGSTGDVEALAKPYLTRLSGEGASRLDGVFVIPADAFTNEKARLRHYSRSSTDFVSQERLGDLANRAIVRNRLTARGVAPAEVEKAMADLDVDSVQISKSGEQKKGGVANLIIGVVFTALLMLPSFVYGLDIMRGIIQEKTDRVVEVLISSMTPTQLLTGKILGIAAVGLTQIAAWSVMGIGIVVFSAGMAVASGFDISQVVHVSTFVYFVIFFILAYLTYVCVYAVGGAVCNTEREAQQLIAPITVTMMLPWVMIGAILTNPDSPFVVAMSMAPVWGPLTMFVRTLIAEPPMGQVLITIATSIVTVSLFLWATAKIFRVGILSYGKRPTIPELWRWMKVA